MIIIYPSFISCILDLQSIPRESNNKDVAAMLVELTIEANEKSFVIVHQYGGNDVNCNPRISGLSRALISLVTLTYLGFVPSGMGLRKGGYVFYLFYDTLYTYIAILVSHFCYHKTLVS